MKCKEEFFNKLRFGVMLIASILIIFLASRDQIVEARTPANLQPGSTVRTVSVTGEAEIKVPPDEVILTLGVETWDKDLKTARQNNEIVQKKLLDLSNQLHIESKYIQTDYISIHPRTEVEKYQTFIAGYFVRQTTVITLKDISKFEPLLTGALEAGVNFVHGIDFRTTELRKYRDQARSLAIKASHEKATALAGELKQQITEPQKITEVQNYWGGSYGSWWGGWRGSASQNVTQNVSNNSMPSLDGSLSPGQITIRAIVQVEFGLKE